MHKQSMNNPVIDLTMQDPQAQYVLGIDIGGTNLRIALSPSHKVGPHKWSTTLPQAPSPESVIDSIRTGAKSLLQQAGVSQNNLVAAGAGAPGITDTAQGIVIATSYLLGWRNVPLQALLEEALQVPASIDNDVNLAALGELHSGAAQDISDFVFIAVGTGVGAGIVLNRQLHRGSAWSAGEIGYMLVPGVSEAPAQRGEPGALESLVGGTGIQSQWRQHWSAQATDLPIDATPTEIFTASATDPFASEILAAAAKTLAYAIYNTSLILNCKLFVLGGGAGSHPAFITTTQRFLDERNSRTPLTVVPSALGPEAQLAGALSLAWQTAAMQTKL
jgi:glucokinase